MAPNYNTNQPFYDPRINNRTVTNNFNTVQRPPQNFNNFAPPKNNYVPPPQQAKQQNITSIITPRQGNVPYSNNFYGNLNAYPRYK